MGEEFESLDEFEISWGSDALLNATAVLVLGILSMVIWILYGIIGLILGITAIALHKRVKHCTYQIKLNMSNLLKTQNLILFAE
mgnify:CR=1 FL=1